MARSVQKLDESISKKTVYTVPVVEVKLDAKIFKKPIESITVEEIKNYEPGSRFLAKSETHAPNSITDYPPVKDLKEDHLVGLIQEMAKCNINADNAPMVDNSIHSNQNYPDYNQSYLQCNQNYPQCNQNNPQCNQNTASYEAQNEFFNLSMNTQAIPNPNVPNHLFHQYIPQQYYGQYYAQPYYSHPIDRPMYSTTYELPRTDQKYLRYTPHNTFIDPYQAYSNNYTASAFAKWQDDYAKWYKTYGEAYELQQSRRDSHLSSINQVRNDTCDTDIFSRFSNYGQRDTSDIVSVKDETAYISDNIRNTPLIYPASHSFARFGPNNTLVLFLRSIR
ncbi:hypothetical protein MXB_4520 [Myxobolus squamalis]|nr:hypothetical protein MXB_4520 [Myxobolus squamalis]